MARSTRAASADSAKTAVAVPRGASLAAHVGPLRRPPHPGYRRAAARSRYCLRPGGCHREWRRGSHRTATSSSKGGRARSAGDARRFECACRAAGGRCHPRSMNRSGGPARLGDERVPWLARCSDEQEPVSREVGRWAVAVASRGRASGRAGLCCPAFPSLRSHGGVGAWRKRPSAVRRAASRGARARSPVAIGYDWRRQWHCGRSVIHIAGLLPEKKTTANEVKITISLDSFGWAVGYRPRHAVVMTIAAARSAVDGRFLG